MINLPKDVIFILNKIHENNFKAYCVGGGIRDLLLGLVPKDFDFATDARPNDIKQIFKDFYYLDVGEKYGTISVKHHLKFYEITTFRKDINYYDHRRPEYVIFSNDLYEDLSRRDFTINALAYNIEEGLIDYFNGLTDLNNKTIHAVGNPYIRFEEDALRIMRAIRFSVTYNFTIENETFEAMKIKKNNLLNISLERLHSEFFKILSAINSSEWNLYQEFFAVFIPELNNIEYSQERLQVLENIEKDLIQRLAIILYDFKDEASVILKRLKCSNQLINDVQKLINYIPTDLKDNKTAIKQILKETEEESFVRIIKIKKVQSMIMEDIITFNKLVRIEKLLNIIITNKEPYLIRDLQIKGRDLLNIGYKKGPIIKQILLELLDEVIINPNINDYETLIMMAKSKL